MCFYLLNNLLVFTFWLRWPRLKRNLLLHYKIAVLPNSRKIVTAPTVDGRYWWNLIAIAITLQYSLGFIKECCTSVSRFIWQEKSKHFERWGSTTPAFSREDNVLRKRVFKYNE
jgi:hypothetical protein